jgi:hypothetical protein
MFSRSERDGLPQIGHLAPFDVRKGKAGVASTDIGRYEFHHNPAAARIADAPLSAPSAP